jgi:hypothetical protein
MRPTLQSALQDLLNSYSRENESNTPDFVLAEYLMNCLIAYEKAIQERNKAQTPCEPM